MIWFERVIVIVFALITSAIFGLFLPITLAWLPLGILSTFGLLHDYRPWLIWLILSMCLALDMPSPLFGAAVILMILNMLWVLALKHFLTRQTRATSALAYLGTTLIAYIIGDVVLHVLINFIYHPVQIIQWPYSFGGIMLYSVTAILSLFIFRSYKYYRLINFQFS